MTVPLTEPKLSHTGLRPAGHSYHWALPRSLSVYLQHPLKLHCSVGWRAVMQFINTNRRYLKMKWWYLQNCLTLVSSLSSHRVCCSCKGLNFHLTKTLPISRNQNSRQLTPFSADLFLYDLIYDSVLSTVSDEGTVWVSWMLYFKPRAHVQSRMHFWGRVKNKE